MMIRIKTFVLHLLNMVGYGLYKLNRVGGQEYGPVTPIATYRPWNKDSLFLDAYAKVQSSTLVDLYQCYDLWSLVGESAKLPGGDIIQVGAWRGGTGVLMAKRASDCGLQASVYLCDTFSGVVKAGNNDSIYKGGEHSDATAKGVLDLAQSLGLTNVKVLEGMFPDQTGAEVAQAQFRFCHIDVDVYQSASDSMDFIWPRLLRGGIVVFDDYGIESCPGIAKYVNEQKTRADRLVLHNLNGNAVMVKL